MVFFLCTRRPRLSLPPISFMQYISFPRSSSTASIMVKKNFFFGTDDLRNIMQRSRKGRGGVIFLARSHFCVTQRPRKKTQQSKQAVRPTCNYAAAAAAAEKRSRSAGGGRQLCSSGRVERSCCSEGRGNLHLREYGGGEGGQLHRHRSRSRRSHVLDTGRGRGGKGGEGLRQRRRFAQMTLTEKKGEEGEEGCCCSSDRPRWAAATTAPAAKPDLKVPYSPSTLSLNPSSSSVGPSAIFVAMRKRASKRRRRRVQALDGGKGRGGLGWLG